MNGDLLVLIFVVITVFVLVISKTHIAFVILALCAGYVLREFAAPELVDLVDGWISSAEFPVYEVVNVSLTLLPALLIAFRFRGTQRGPSRFVQQIVPALALTLLALVFLIDILPQDASEKIKDNAYLAGFFDTYAWLIVVFAIAVALFDVLVKHANEPIRKKRGPGRPPKH